MEASGLVEATERLYRSLFTAAVGFAVGAAAWGLVIAPFNGFDHHGPRSLALGVGFGAVALAAFIRRGALFLRLRRQPAWLLVGVALAIGILWSDGGWRSSYYVASYTPIVLAAVVGGLRWSLLCALLLALGYILGLVVNDYSWARLTALNDADSVIANTGGYLLAGYFLAAPVSWLGGYVARINQVVGSASPNGQLAANVLPSDPAERLTDRLSVREVEVVQLVAAGGTNEEIADQLVLSPRTIQSHVEHALRKTETRNRTELAVLAALEGLVPAKDGLEVDAPQPTPDPPPNG